MRSAALGWADLDDHAGEEPVAHEIGEPAPDDGEAQLLEPLEQPAEPARDQIQHDRKRKPPSVHLGHLTPPQFVFIKDTHGLASESFSRRFALSCDVCFRMQATKAFGIEWTRLEEGPERDPGPYTFDSRP